MTQELIRAFASMHETTLGAIEAITRLTRELEWSTYRGATCRSVLSEALR